MASDSSPAWEIASIQAAWPGWVDGLEPDLSTKLARCAPAAIAGPGQLVIAFDRAYNWVADMCDTLEARTRIESKVGMWLGKPVSIRIDRPPEEPLPPSRTAVAISRDEALKDDPMIKQIVELFEAKAIRVDVEDDSTS